MGSIENIFIIIIALYTCFNSELVGIFYVVVICYVIRFLTSVDTSIAIHKNCMLEKETEALRL